MDKEICKRTIVQGTTTSQQRAYNKSLFADPEQMCFNIHWQPIHYNIVVGQLLYISNININNGFNFCLVKIKYKKMQYVHVFFFIFYVRGGCCIEQYFAGIVYRVMYVQVSPFTGTSVNNWPFCHPKLAPLLTIALMIFRLESRASCNVVSLIVLNPPKLKKYFLALLKNHHAYPPDP